MTKFTIRLATTADTPDIHRFVVTAFAPIFESLHGMMGPTVFAFYYPDWHQVQRDLVDALMADDDAHVYVAVADDAAVGFLAYRLKPEMEGEIELLFVDPGHQGGGVGTALNNFALDQMRAAGMRVATAATGGDPGHAAARRAYEKAGFTPVQQVWYIQSLSGDD
ncbi:MAG: GNAT family N-acetyltransferase [Chloroflexota bacterium]